MSSVRDQTDARFLENQRRLARRLRHQVLRNDELLRSERLEDSGADQTRSSCCWSRIFCRWIEDLTFFCRSCRAVVVESDGHDQTASAGAGAAEEVEARWLAMISAALTGSFLASSASRGSTGGSRSPLAVAIDEAMAELVEP